MEKINEEQLKLEIDHIFESGANELRVFEMVKNFIDSRNVVNKNFVLADVSGSLGFDEGYAKGYSDATKEACQEIREHYHPNDR
jgi:hypothetical protein